MSHLTRTCAAIIAGYAAKKSGFDDDMIVLLQDIGDSAEEIIGLVEDNARLNLRIATLAQLNFDLEREIEKLTDWSLGMKERLAVQP